MPTYDYKCTKCTHSFEQVKKMAERDDVAADTCPACSEVGSIERLVASPLIGYSVVSNGSYGTKVPEGFRDVLRKIDERSPGSRMKETSAFL